MNIVIIISVQGYYDTMDSGFRDKKGYVAVMSRSDDVINVAGHRLSTGALEEVSFKNVFFSHSKVSKGAKIRNRYNQAPHPTQV